MRCALWLLPLALLGACRGAAPAPTAAPTVAVARAGARLFTDSAVYRARCQEADTIRTLAPVPQRCTPRDQRQPVKIF